jgi:hypothetical protein
MEAVIFFTCINMALSVVSLEILIPFTSCGQLRVFLLSDSKITLERFFSAKFALFLDLIWKQDLISNSALSCYFMHVMWTLTDAFSFWKWHGDAVMTENAPCHTHSKLLQDHCGRNSCGKVFISFCKFSALRELLRWLRWHRNILSRNALQF